MQLISFSFTLFFLLTNYCYVTAGTPTPPDYPEECKVLDNITNTIVRQPGLPMICGKNTQCTGFNCEGKYNYTGVYTGLTPFILKFCFGIALHPCNDPVTMEVYLMSPENNVTFERTVQHDQMIQIPHLHYQMGNGIPKYTADGFIKINMEPQPRRGKRYIKIGVKFLVRVTIDYVIGKKETYPDELQRYLMPNTTVPVPDCDPQVVTPTHAPGHCSIPQTFPTYQYSTVPTLPVAIVSCDPHNLVEWACKQHETCTSDGYCACKWPSETINGICVHIKPPFPDSPHNKTGSPPNTPAGSGMSTSTRNIIIGVCSAVGIIAMSVLLVILVIRHRRHQARYGNHILLTEDMDEDVDDELLDDHNPVA